MAKQKKLNKNLVAFLTVMGIVLTVAVVAIATMQTAKKDPEAFAKAAAEKEKAGDLQRAIELYKRAFDVSKDPKYFVDASKCAWGIGEIPLALALLNDAHNAAPSDPVALGELLRRYWEIKDLGPFTEPLRQHSDTMLRLNPDDVLALLCRAVALNRLARDDASLAEQATAALNQAIEKNPTDPRVVETRAVLEIEAFQRKVIASGVTTLSREEFESQVREYRERASRYLAEGLKANPGHARLSISQAALLQDMGRAEEAGALLEAAASANPDDADVQVSYARLLLARAGALSADADAAARTALLDKAAAACRRAVEIDPATYDAYILLAQSKMLAGGGDAPEAVIQRHRAAMAVYDEALQKTVGVRSFRARIDPDGRERILFQAFQTARILQTRVTDAATREDCAERTRKYLSAAQTEFKDRPYTLTMQGEVALAERNYRAAILAFAKVEEQTQAEPRYLQLNLMSNEYLAGLYREENEPKLALKHADRALATYQSRGLAPRTGVLLARIAALSELERHQEALDLAESVLREQPDNRDVLRLKVAALSRLGRNEEAERLLAENAAAGGDVQTRVMQALILANNKDYDRATTLLREILEKDPNQIDVLQHYVRIMAAADKRADANSFLNTIRPKVTDERAKRLISVYDVSLTVDDPEERFTRLKAIIDAIPDPATRLSELFSLYSERNDLVSAAAALDELEKLQPNSPAVLEYQLRTAIRREQWDRAEQYCSKLADINGDLAGGAVFRGDLAMARGDAERAIQQFRIASTALPNDSDIKVRLAQALLSMRPPAFAEAEETLKQALETSPQNFVANRLMFIVMDEQERTEEGLPYLQTAARINPADDYIRSKSDFIAEEADPAAGIAKREQTRAANPTDIDNLIRLAELYAKNKQPDKAAELYQAAAAIDPASRKLARSGGTFYANARRREAGEALLRGFIDAQQERGKVQGLLMLARFYELLGDLTAARDGYVAAKEACATAITIPAERREMQIRTAFELIEFYYRVALVKEMIDAARYALTLLQPGEVAYMQNARLRIIEGLLRTRRLGDAESEVKTYLADYPDELRGLLALSQLQLAQNKVREARDVLTRILNAAPNHAWALFTRGTINMQMRDYAQARNDLQNAKRLAPTAFDLAHRLRLAQLYEQIGEVSLAEAELREVLELAPNSNSVASALLRVFQTYKQYDKARALISEFMGRYPDEPYWPFQMGTLMMEREEYSQAVTAFHRVVDLTKGENSAAVAFWLQALTRSNRGEEALAHFAEMQRNVTVPPAVRVAAAEAMVATNRRADAEQNARQALLEAAAESMGDALLAGARLVQVLGSEGADKLFREALAQAPADEYSAMRLRLVLAEALAARVKDPTAAAEPLKILDEVVAASGDQSPERLKALLLRARLLSITGDAEGMTAAYEQVLVANDRNVEALNNLAFFLADRFNRPQEALLYAQRLAEMAGNDANILDTIGWVYLLNGKIEEAQATLLDAVRIAPDNASAQYHLGEAYLRAGRVSDASGPLQRALELAKKAEDSELVAKIEAAMQKQP